MGGVFNLNTMNDIELEQRIKEIRDKAIASIREEKQSEISKEEKIRRIDQTLSLDISRSLIRANVVNSVRDIKLQFLYCRGAVGIQYEYPIPTSGMKFTIPRVDEPDFDNKRLFEFKSRNTVGLLCDVDEKFHPKGKVLVFISSFYYNWKVPVIDIDGKPYYTKIHGKGMDGLSEILSNTKTIIGKIKELCKRVGGKSFLVEMYSVYHLKSNNLQLS